MKSFRPVQQVLADAEQVLSERYDWRSSPIDRVLKLLLDGRHYDSIAIHLSARWSAAAAPDERGSGVRIPLKLAGRTLGFLEVISASSPQLRSEDRRLLHDVAALLARYLAGPGRHVLLAMQKPSRDGEDLG